MTSVAQSGSLATIRARTDHPDHFGQRGAWVVDVLQRSVGPAAVERGVREVEAMDVADPELQPQVGALAAPDSLGDHRLTAVDTDNETALAHHARQRPRVVPRPAADVQQPGPRLPVEERKALALVGLGCLHSAHRAEILDVGHRVRRPIDGRESPGGLLSWHAILPATTTRRPAQYKLRSLYSAP